VSDETVPRAEVDDWLDAIARLYGGGNWDAIDAQRADRAVSLLLSEFGYLDAPLEVLQMFHQAIEVGYLTALEHVRAGNFDGEIKMWRPDLADD
jgi:hypothetical protein